MSCGCSYARTPCSEFCGCGTSCLNKSNADSDTVYNESDSEDDDEEAENDDDIYAKRCNKYRYSIVI